MCGDRPTSTADGRSVPLSLAFPFIFSRSPEQFTHLLLFPNAPLHYYRDYHLSSLILPSRGPFRVLPWLSHLASSPCPPYRHPSLHLHLHLHFRFCICSRKRHTPLCSVGPVFVGTGLRFWTLPGRSAIENLRKKLSCHTLPR